LSTKVFYSHGKLLITGEYVVLDGAKALAVPTNKGQYLAVKPIDDYKLYWKSFDENNQVWFEDSFLLDKLSVENTNNDISKKLIEILIAAKKLSPSFLSKKTGCYVTTKLTFNRFYGLGSSSTLIANIAKWANVDPYKLLWNSFKGSGYDLACAMNNSSLQYQITNNLPQVKLFSFNPNFKDNIYFVYLNKKQDSKEGISLYRALTEGFKKRAITKINLVTENLINCGTLEEFNKLLSLHENIISTLIGVTPVQEANFKDYNNGVVKSLGAWGGDFVLVTVKDKNDINYFREKGYSDIFSYKKMLL
jgi:mevalonate kinase